MKFNFMNWIVDLRQRIKNDPRERRRFYILLFGLIFFVDYIMFCYISDENIFSIIPSIPVLSTKNKVNIYFPNIDGKSVFKEIIDVPQLDSETRFAGYLFNMVVKGSIYKNTSVITPVNPFIRRLWIYGKRKKTLNGKYCIIDIEPVILQDTSKIIKGSEAIFIQAIEKTIMENIPSIKKVIFLEGGVPVKNLWEM